MKEDVTMLVTTTQRPVDSASWNLRRLNRFFDDAFGTGGFDDAPAGLVSAWVPPCDIFENQESVKLVLELPGVKPEDVKLSLENGTMMIRGEKKQVAEEKTERVHRYERSYGVFERRFSLPNSVDVEAIKANFEQGVLTVTLPKVERARPREIPVTSS
jgi:HSP20 family protein